MWVAAFKGRPTVSVVPLETGCEIPFRCWSLSARLCSASVTLALVCELLVSARQVQAILFVTHRHYHLLTQHLFTFAVLQ